MLERKERKEIQIKEQRKLIREQGIHQSPRCRSQKNENQQDADQYLIKREVEFQTSSASHFHIYFGHQFYTE